MPIALSLNAHKLAFLFCTGFVFIVALIASNRIKLYRSVISDIIFVLHLFQLVDRCFKKVARNSLAKIR